VQVKLLRVLQERTYEPLGSIAPERTNARIIAATNADLEIRVHEERFRQDLFYRLNVVRLHLPPLRERRSDIPLLINHFIRQLNTLQDKSIQGVSEDVLAVLMRHSFPGNVRELENIIEFAFILCSTGFIQLEHLPESLHPASAEICLPVRARTLEEIKCLAVRAALERNNGKRMATCRELGITKDTLRSLIGRCPLEDE
jgi:transcriptional regulator with PAS, ATPase and Fis domain